MLRSGETTDLSAAQLVARHGDVFAVFDGTTQDSGNVSYGVRIDQQRYFAKTAGVSHDPRPLLSHPDRVALLRNATRLAHGAAHDALPRLLNFVECSDGPMLVYEWVDGELLGATRARRLDPSSAYARFRALPAQEVTIALDRVLHLHAQLARSGWIAGDFYDGCLIYDFAARRVRVVDLDNYRDAPFVNEVGRMFGSTRFMAPEELELGAAIDERTTVFNMGRVIEQLFPAADARVVAVAERACEPDRTRRFASVGELYDAWSAANHAGGYGEGGDASVSKLPSGSRTCASVE